MSDISIYINPYTINSGAVTPDYNDELQLWMCPDDDPEPCLASEFGVQILQGVNADSININPLGSDNRFLVQIQNLSIEGYLELRLNSTNNSNFIHFATTDGSTYFPKPFINASAGTLELYGSSTISPDFVFEEMAGCRDGAQFGPYPDIFGNCRDTMPEGPNEFGYCKNPNLPPYNHGYVFCNYNPNANVDDGSCFERGYQETIDFYSPVPDSTFCDCFGHTSDCNNNCLSDSDIGNPECKNHLNDWDSTGCSIALCDGSCSTIDSFDNYYNTHYPDGNGDCTAFMTGPYSCHSVNQGIGHPQIGNYNINQNGLLYLGCDYGDCLDCAGGCAENAQDFSDFESDICHECIGTTSTSTVFPCKADWQSDGVCMSGWSQDCHDACPPISYAIYEEDEWIANPNWPGDSGWDATVGYEGPCYGASAAEVTSNYNFSPTNTHFCGYDCNGICGGDSVVDECGYCGGDGIPDGECDCSSADGGDPHYLDCGGNCVPAEDMLVEDCYGQCDGPHYEDMCGVCNDNPEDDCVQDCSGEWGGDKVIDECGICNGDNYFTIDGQVAGTPCEKWSSANCLNSSNQSCDCFDNSYDCRAETATNSAEFEASCLGTWELDECGVCGGDGIADGFCDCDFNVLDCNDVCGGEGVLDVCGICRDNFTGDNQYAENGWPWCDCGGDTCPCCDCDKNTPEYWCYDGDGDGYGCGGCNDFGTQPRWFCGNPGQGQFDDDWITGEYVDVETWCPSNVIDECNCQQNPCYDDCGTCNGGVFGSICPNNTTVCCNGEPYCDCSSTCRYDLPSGNLGYNSAGNYTGTDYYDCAGVCNGDTELDICGVCNGSGIPAGNCDCNGGILDCNNQCPFIYQDGQWVINDSYTGVEYDNCGNCPGDCQGLEYPDNCPDENICGYCLDLGVPDPVICSIDDPSSTYNQVCNCEGDAVCDSCGVCGGLGGDNYYYDNDGDGKICGPSDQVPLEICTDLNQELLVTKCGPPAGPFGGDCYVLASNNPQFDDEFCDCPWTYDECGRCVDYSGEQEFCNPNYEECISEGDSGCNSKFCRNVEYMCDNSSCDGQFYIFDYMPEFATGGWIAPIFQPNGQERPQEDACGDCKRPYCSGWGFDDSGDLPPLPPVNGNPCIIGNEENGVPTNMGWNSQCVACDTGSGGQVGGDNLIACDGSCIEYSGLDLGGGICNPLYACEKQLQYPGHPQAESDGYFYFNCDEGDCVGCDGVCREIPYVNQYNINGDLCGCDVPDTLVNQYGCCNNGVLDCTGTTCSENQFYCGDGYTPGSGFDCGGTCCGTAEYVTCCNEDSNIEYCLGDNGGPELDGMVCNDVVLCGCYDNPDACNNLGEWPGGDKDSWSGGQYSCKYPSSDGYYLIGEDGFITDEWVSLCGDDFGTGVYDCCDCDGNTLDCDFNCGGGNLRQTWFYDHDCDGSGYGDPTMEVYCSHELPITTGCWSLNSTDANPYCDETLIWDNSIPSSNGIPTEPEVCKATEASGGSSGDFGDYCSAIQSQGVCESDQNPECKWEKDYFFGVDDCGICFRTGLGVNDTATNFNIFGDTSQDCAGNCTGDNDFDGTDNGLGPGRDICGDCYTDEYYSDGIRCSGCIHEAGDLTSNECYDSDGDDMECTHDCHAIDGTYYGCCDFLAEAIDCLGKDPIANNGNPAAYDKCGICSGGTSGVIPNHSFHCNCCPPEGSSFYGAHIDPSFTYFGMCTEGNYQAGDTYYTIEEWIEFKELEGGGLDWWYYDDVGDWDYDFAMYNGTPDHPGPWTDCGRVCFGNDYVDSCGDCSDPSTARDTVETFPGYDYSNYGTNKLQCDCVEKVSYYWDDCGNCELPGTGLFNQECINPGNAGAQCSCPDGNPIQCDQCMNCGGDGFNSSCYLKEYTCNDMDCLGQCNGLAEWDIPHDSIGYQCCLEGDKDDCGVCFGDGNYRGCDGICFSGLVNQGCGCDDGPAVIHYFDADGDGMGNEFQWTYICPLGTADEGWNQGLGESLLDDMPTNYDNCENENCTATWTIYGGDTDDTCPGGEVDECGVCNGDNVYCFGCTDETACNYGMNREGNLCPNGVCTESDPAVCLLKDEYECPECSGGQLYFCPSTYTKIQGNINIDNVAICNTFNLEYYTENNCQSDICSTATDCPDFNDCGGTYCEGLGETPEDYCDYVDQCGVCNDLLSGSYGCLNGNWDDCACAGCTDTSNNNCNGAWDPNAQYDDGSCPPYDCNGDCGGIADYDSCGNCCGGNAGDCVQNDTYNCGCFDQQPWSDNPFDIGNYCNQCLDEDGQTPIDCPDEPWVDNSWPLGCNGNQWHGCEICGMEPDDCGTDDSGNDTGLGPYNNGFCPPYYGGCNARNCMCEYCGDVTACNYEEVPDGGSPTRRNDNLCKWLNHGDQDGNFQECVCTQPWDDGNWGSHNEYCPNGSFFVDDCGIVRDINDPDWNECIGCWDDPTALNYNPNAPIEGPCVFGDLVLTPQSDSGLGIDSYVLRPAGPDTEGAPCDEYEPDYGACNDNYGGIKIVDTDGSNMLVKAYHIEIRNSTGGIDPNGDVWATDNGAAFNDGSNWHNSGQFQSTIDNPECNIHKNGGYKNGMYNMHTFVNCGYGKTFSMNDTFTITLTIWDIELHSFVITKTVEIGSSTDWKVSIYDNYMPYQGMNIPDAVLDGTFKFKKQDFESITNGGYDTDERPSLGMFYYSDEPTSWGLIYGGNLDSDGFYVDYYRDSKSMSGKKWGGNSGVGKEFEGLLPDIEKECGVDLGIVTNYTQLSTTPSGPDSNRKCGALTDSPWNTFTWLPDALVYTERSWNVPSWSGNTGAFLWEYWDKDENPLQYEATSGPTEAIVYFQPKQNPNEPWDDTMPAVMDPAKPIYITQLDWGDGEIEFERSLHNLTTDGQEIKHSYSKPGIYEIKGYMFSMASDRTCVNYEGIPDGRKWMCNNDQHCRGYCNLQTEKCVGGTAEALGLSCSAGRCPGQQCECNDIPQGTDIEDQITCSEMSLGTEAWDTFGVDRFVKFTLRININEPEEYDEHPYIINKTGLPQITVSGLSKNSIYYKNTLRQLGFIPELPDDPLDTYFQYSYDEHMAEWALVQMDETLIGNDIAAFMTPVEYNGNIIFNGKYFDGHGQMGKYIGNSDIGQVRYFNTNISMAEMFGFEDSDLDIVGKPDEDRYWKNIITEDTTIDQREGINPIEDNRIEISELSDQNWLDGSYYPVLPKLNRYGEFDETLGFQGDKIPFGSSDRTWDGVDDLALVTSITSNDFNQYLLLDIDFSSDNGGILQDISGNGNDGILINDYRINYEEETRIPEKQESQQTPQLDKDGRQF